MKKPNDTMHGPYETKKAADIRSSGAVRHAQKSSIQHLTAIVEDRNPDAVMEKLFHVTARGTTWQNECLCGLIQFVSCMYVLPVVPIQLSAAGFETTATINATAVLCGVGCLIAGFFANLPFIIAPPTAVSIFYSVFIQQNNFEVDMGSSCVVVCGLLLMFFGYGPLGYYSTKLIPQCIQAGTAVGIGLITALAGATEIDLVKTGKYTIVDIGKITDEVVISLCGFIMIAVALYYRMKAAFCITLLFNTFVWWTNHDIWPSTIAETPHIDRIHTFFSSDQQNEQALLIFELVFLCLLTLSGLVKSMSDLSHLTREDGTTPRNRWLFIMCGMMTMLSGYLRGPPILISPESAGGIKAGAKTGLSTIVCGVFFCLSTFFSPLMSEVPACATAPLLLAVGVILCQNVKRIDFSDILSAFPAFCCIFFIPFTYNILFGVALGYVMFVSIGLLTGHFNEDIMMFFELIFKGEISSEVYLASDASNSGQGPPPDLVPRISEFSNVAISMDGVDPNIHIVEGFYHTDDEDSTKQRKSFIFSRPGTSNSFQKNYDLNDTDNSKM